MKRNLTYLVAASLCSFALAACGNPAASSSEGAASSTPDTSVTPTASTSSAAAARMATKQYPLYFVDPSAKSTINLSFHDSVMDIPYLDSATIVKVLNTGLSMNGDARYKMSFTDDAGVVTFLRENGSKCVVNFPKQSMTFNDFDLFNSLGFAFGGLDIDPNENINSVGKSEYVERQKAESYYRPVAALSFAPLGCLYNAPQKPRASSGSLAERPLLTSRSQLIPPAVPILLIYKISQSVTLLPLILWRILAQPATSSSFFQESLFMSLPETVTASLVALRKNLEIRIPFR